ncbi:hypothetical protein WR25_20959 [Diploscapter pachys]|uniref:2-amino-3-carboxymuconate-6-semialdehyde decarboxylase n=1 Tax=Diploscapter pachys TaxID=2018661 RepID=A0A2A2JWS1_9BILA|nr:hypothetical protein WR25_20959 [Diploscapter pachys]
MKGFEIGSHVGEKSLDHKDFWPLYKECEKLGALLFVHPWDMDSWNGRLNKHWMPWLVGMPSETAQAICSVLMGNVLVEFPKLKLCFAHGGGAYPSIAGRDRIVLGTDYPFPLGELEVGKVVEEYNALAEQDKNDMLWGNAIKMLDLDENTLAK